MNQNTHQPLEVAIIDLVEAELDIMRSFCQPGFPCDARTSIAMRMSRSLVSAVCGLSQTTDLDKQLVMSQATVDSMITSERTLHRLVLQYEGRLEFLPSTDPAWQSWVA